MQCSILEVEKWGLCLLMLFLCHWNIFYWIAIQVLADGWAAQESSIYFCQLLGGRAIHSVWEMGLSHTHDQQIVWKYVWHQGSLHEDETYLMIACCSKSNWEFHGDNSNAFLLPIVLLVELFHFLSSAMKGRLVQAFIPTSYHVFGVECLFIDGFINSFVHVFLSNLKRVGYRVNSYGKIETKTANTDCKSLFLKYGLVGRRQSLSSLDTMCFFIGYSVRHVYHVYHLFFNQGLYLWK